jgi:hypothetical protein
MQFKYRMTLPLLCFISVFVQVYPRFDNAVVFFEFINFEQFLALKDFVVDNNTKQTAFENILKEIVGKNGSSTFESNFQTREEWVAFVSLLARFSYLIK